MKIKHIETDRGGEFVIEENGNRAAEMTYTKSGANKISFDHTFVEKDSRGSGIGKNLVAEGVEFARKNNLSVTPLCPFVKSEFEKNESYADVLEK
jgi:predicted GNAT family acetyltransferase